MPRAAPLLTLLIACDPAQIATPGGGEEGGGDDTAEPVAYEIVSMQARLHEEYGSLIYVSWEQPASGESWVEYRFDEEDWRESPALSVTAGPAEALVLGVPYGREATYRVVTAIDGQTVASAEATIATEPVPEGLPLPEVISSRPEAQDPGSPYLFTSVNIDEGYIGGEVYTLILDRAGRVVWARETPRFFTSLHPRISLDGADLLIDHNSYWVTFDADDSQVVRMKIDGSEVATYDTPGLHHPFTDLPDGSIVWGAMDGWSETLEQVTMSGVQTRIWDCQGFHEVVDVNEYCTSNTVSWRADEDTFLFSFYTTETVVEIDRQTGQTLRWFGHLPGSWSFEPEDSAFWWQHGGYVTAAGTLLISTHSTRQGGETVVREYEMDQGSETLAQVWAFGEGEGVYGEDMGEAHRLGNGNTLHNYGTNPRIREVTPAGDVVWDIAWSGQRFVGRSMPIPDLYALAP